MFAVRQTIRTLFLSCDGRVAQLGERIHGMDEAAGSIPVTSTNFSNGMSPRGGRACMCVPAEPGRRHARSLTQKEEIAQIQ